MKWKQFCSTLLLCEQVGHKLINLIEKWGFVYTTIVSPLPMNKQVCALEQGSRSGIPYISCKNRISMNCFALVPKRLAEVAMKIGARKKEVPLGKDIL